MSASTSASSLPSVHSIRISSPPLHQSASTASHRPTPITTTNSAAADSSSSAYDTSPMIQAMLLTSTNKEPMSASVTGDEPDQGGYSNSSGGYGAYIASPMAASASPSTPSFTPATSSSILTHTTPQQTYALMREWERQHIFPWTQRRLSEAAHAVMMGAGVPVAAVPASTPSSSSIPSSSSYLWRSQRWSFLQSYPVTQWNTLYQSLYEHTSMSAYDRSRKATQQKQLLEEFAKFARNTVELIMEEVHLPAVLPNNAPDPSHLHTKFLPPLNIGGLAGGEKYILNGILFKFARDWSGLFSSVQRAASGGSGDSASHFFDTISDEYVQKSAANEIRHMSSLIHNDSYLLLHIPLCLTMSCLLRIRGSVVMCTALAPINGGESIVYGSSDAGACVKDGSEGDGNVRNIVETLAERWHLRSHPVRASSTQLIHSLPLATDIEIHCSPQDGRLYILDLARFLPPTPPQRGTMQHLYHMWRPEFMRKELLPPMIDKAAAGDDTPTTTKPSSSQPRHYDSLSADVFSGFGSIDSAIYTSPIHSNMRHLKYNLIPRVAQKLEEWWEKYELVIHEEDKMKTNEIMKTISKIMHESGVNIRYLGLVRAYLPSSSSSSSTSSTKPSLSTILLYNMIARTLKHLYFSWIRYMMLVSSSSNNAASGGKQPEWTEVDLERWKRSVEGDTSTSKSSDDTTSVSTSHHESSLLFAVLLSFLFHPSSSSSTFFTHLLWPSLFSKFLSLTVSTSEYALYEKDCQERGVELSEKRSAEIKSKTESIVTLLNQQDMQAFQDECAGVMTSTADSSSQSSILLFITMLFHQVSFDHESYRQIVKLSATETSFLDLTKVVVKQIVMLESGSSSSLTPSLITHLYLLPFHSRLTQVSLQSFLSLEDTESQLTITLQNRARRMGKEHYSLLGALWAMIELYEMHRMEEKSTTSGTIYQQQHQNVQISSQSIPTSSPTLLTSTSSTVLPSSHPKLLRQETYYDKCQSVLKQIEDIYENILRSSSTNVDTSTAPSSTTQPTTSNLSLINYSKFGWFYLHRGELNRAHTYFEKDFMIKKKVVEMVEREATASGNDASPLSSSLLQLASSSESLGIINRELNHSVKSLECFERSLMLYKRVYGEFEVVVEVQECGEKASTSNTTSSSTSSPSASHFHTSLELATLYTNLGNSHGSTGNIQQKLAYLKAAHKIMLHHLNNAAESNGIPHPNLISITTNLAACYTSSLYQNVTTEELEKAREMLEQCVGWTKILHPTAVTEQKGGEITSTSSSPPQQEHVSLSSIYTALANVHGKLNNPSKRIELLRRALTIVEHHHGESHPEVAVILTNLGVTYGEVGQLAEGLAVLQRSLQIKTQLYGSPLHTEVGITLSNMGVIFAKAGDWKQEFRCAQQALQIFMTVAQKQSQQQVANPSTSVSTSTTSSSTTAASLLTNPHLLYSQQRFFRARQSMCAHEKYALENKLCSYYATGNNRTMHQEWFKCVTCEEKNSNEKAAAAGLGVCLNCSEICHAGHQLEKQPPAQFYCDCGEGVFKEKCKAMVLRKSDVEVASSVAANSVGNQSTSSTPPLSAVAASTNAAPSSSASTSSSSSSSSAILLPTPQQLPPFNFSLTLLTHNNVYSHTFTFLKRHKLQRYTRDFTRDLLLVLQGYRVAFITDVSLEMEEWSKLLVEMSKDKDLSSSLKSNDLALLDLCDEGCLFVHRGNFLKKMEEDRKMFVSGDVSTTPIEFINVHPCLADPTTLRDDVKKQYCSNIATVITNLIEQCQPTVASSSATATKILRLPSLSDSSDTLVRSITALSLTTLCGYLLDYPVLYCMHDDNGGSTSSSASLHTNNLSMKPLTRHVASIGICVDVLKSGEMKMLTASDTSSLICSFTVPSALASDAAITRVISKWSEARRMTHVLRAATSCWTSDPPQLHTELVTLPVVAL